MNASAYFDGGHGLLERSRKSDAVYAQEMPGRVHGSLQRCTTSKQEIQVPTCALPLTLT